MRNARAIRSEAAIGACSLLQDKNRCERSFRDATVGLAIISPASEVLSSAYMLFIRSVATYFMSPGCSTNGGTQLSLTGSNHCLLLLSWGSNIYN